MSFWGNETSIIFDHFGIELKNLPHGIMVGDFKIAFYGAVIALGMVLGIAIARWQARRSGQNQENYLDLALWAIPISVCGARIYSVAFEWDYYKNDLLKIFNLRNGGLAIYGGVIAAVLTAFVFCKIKKMNFGTMTDTGILGMVLGQIIGRWGNFFNREAFGKYTDSLFAMRIDVTDVGLSSYFKPSVISDAQLASIYQGKERALANIMEIRNNIVTLEDGRQFIQVQPTFLYESLWNCALLVFMIFIWPKKKFKGEILLIYLSGYGLGRFFIEGLRTDQLFLWNSGLAVSQLLSAGLFVVCTTLIIVLRIRAIRSGAAAALQLEMSEAVKSMQSSSEKEIISTAESSSSAENDEVKSEDNAEFSKPQEETAADNMPSDKEDKKTEEKR